MAFKFSQTPMFGGAAGLAALRPANAWYGKARGQTEQNAVVLIFNSGGYNALFSSADSLVGAGTFGTSADTVTEVGNGLVVDRSTLGTLPLGILQQMATVGINHARNDHGSAEQAAWQSAAGASAPLTLAHAMGGCAGRCVAMGPQLPQGTHAPVKGVSLQRVTDLSATLRTPGAAVEPGSAESAQTFNYAALAEAYGTGAASTAVNSFAMQLLGAEMMIATGVNVITVVSDFLWDGHGDLRGNNVRRQMSRTVMPALTTFLNRNLVAGKNVHVALFGDFARTARGSDHASVTAATVMGPGVRVGTTGRVDSNVALSQGTPSYDGFWAYLARLANTSTQPFGANPHSSITLGSAPFRSALAN